MNATHLSLIKIDTEKRIVIARAAAQEPDRSGEIMDWDTAVPEFKRWSNEMEMATGGLSKGNVRLMHDAKRVVGKVTSLSFNEMQKAVDVELKVVDDAAWKLCTEGCITGISIGGSYARKWKDESTGLTKYTPKITEISLVDNPCIPSARIVELVKADGATEELRLFGRPRGFGEVMSEMPVARDFAACLKAIPPAPVSFDEALAKGFSGVPNPFLSNASSSRSSEDAEPEPAKPKKGALTGRAAINFRMRQVAANGRAPAGSQPGFRKSAGA
jgi:hypothetical protein